MFGKSMFGLIVGIVTIVGALNWGLVGIGYFMGRSLDVVQMIVGGGTAAAVVYIIVGVCGLVALIQSFQK